MLTTRLAFLIVGLSVLTFAGFELARGKAYSRWKKDGWLRRDGQPIRYWLAVALHAAFGGLFAYAAIFGGWPR
jgi:hypothetical protein